MYNQLHQVIYLLHANGNCSSAVTTEPCYNKVTLFPLIIVTLTVETHSKQNGDKGVEPFRPGGALGAGC
jgi:hypothetical protein